MKKILFILAFIPLLIFGQGTQNLTVKRVKTDSLYIQKLASASSSNIVLVLDSLTGKIGKRPYPSGGDSYWQEVSSNLANIDTTTGFYVNSTSGVKNVNLSMYPASSWWRVEQTNRTTGVQSVAQGSAGVVSLQANAGGATDVVQVNGAGYLYGRTGSNGLNLGSSTYRWGTAYVDSVSSTKDITVKGVRVGVGTGETLGNSVLGYNSYVSNVNGRFNTAIGYTSLNKNTDGASNTATGYASLYNNTVGGSNTSLGAQSMYNNTSGNYNTSVGVNSLFANTTGFSNTAIGYKALFANTTGRNNIALGDSAGYAYTTLSNRMYLGARDSTTNGIFFNRNTKIGRWNGSLIADGTVSATGGSSSDWNTAYGWGNHAGLYIPLPEGGITQGDIWYGGDTQTQTIIKPTGEDNYTLKWMGGSGGTPSWQSEEWTKTGTYTVRQNRVGIGVASPLYWLHVGGAVKSDTNITPLVLGGSAVSSSLTLKSTSATGSSDYIAFVTGSGSERVRILSDGKIGIGTTNPSTYTVSIVGSLYASSFIRTGSYVQWSNGLLSGGGNSYFTSGNLGIGTTAPTAQVHLTKDLKIGTTKDSITIDTTNGLRLHGNTVVYDDIVFGFSTGVNGVAAYPAFNADSMYWNFTVDSTSPSLCKKYYTIQIPHRAKEGNITIYPHVHYRHTTTGGTPTFIVKYRWYNIGEKPGAFTWRRLTSTTGTTDGTHQMNYSTLGITKSNSTLSSILDMQVYLYSQTGTGGINAMQFDLHIPIDKLGSDNEYTNN